MGITLVVFLVGSIGAIFAWNIGSLIVFRAIQGVGGAVFPLSFAIIRDEFPPERVRGRWAWCRPCSAWAAAWAWC